VELRLTLEATGGNTTGFTIPPEAVEALGKGRKPPVVVTINGHTWRSTIAVMGGGYMLGVSAENRQKAAIKAGDELDVDLELDTAPRQVEVPADLQEALDREPAARSYFDGLSYSNKRRHILQIEGAKAAETRLRRIEKSVAMFKEGRN
jgi:hypothetical protein